MSCTALPQYVLLEDANDLCHFMVFAGRTIPAVKWVPEVAVAVENARSAESNEGLL